MNASAQPERPFQNNGGGPSSREPDSPALSTGLQLVRASNMASTRLQLALARRDRRQAMAALDGLIDIDAEIERFVAALPPPHGIHPDWTTLTDHLSEQKAAIASEKFSLACGIAGPGLVAAPDPTAEPGEKDRIGAEPEPVRGQIILEPEGAEPRSIWKLAVALIVISAAGLAVAAWLYLDRPSLDMLRSIGG